jgi:FlaA1/EpsC-like NDP-sugar epimerase
VVTTFWRQIQKGGPVSVTHPDVARYFLTVHEVTTLLIQAAALALPGKDQVFVLNVGDEIRIVDLAEKLIRTGGMEPGRDVEIVYTGLRPGDKLREDMVGPDERLVATSHPKIFEAQGPAPALSETLLNELSALEDAPLADAQALVDKLHRLARLDQTGATAPTVPESAR